jgi:hypothetical protein
VEVELDRLQGRRLPSQGRHEGLVLVERPLSGWVSGSTGAEQVVHFRSELVVTNLDQQDAVIIVRVRVGRGAFAYGRALQDCFFVDIGGEPVVPFTPGVKIEPRTTATMRIQHPFKVDVLPRTRTLMFRIVMTDQFNRTHSRRLRSGKLN